MLPGFLVKQMPPERIMINDFYCNNIPEQYEWNTPIPSTIQKLITYLTYEKNFFYKEMKVM